MINKIKRTDLNLLWRCRSTKLVKVFGTEKKVFINELQPFINETNHAFNSSEITNHINSKLKKSYKTSFIRAVMKHDLKLSFKKVKPRPHTAKFDILDASRQLFSVKFSQLINNSTLVISIDETSFNRHIKNSYSWSRKGYRLRQRILRLLDQLIPEWQYYQAYNGSYYWQTKHHIQKNVCYFFTSWIVEFLQMKALGTKIY